LNGGDEGKSLVEDFMAKDALDPITIEFLEDLGVWGQTDSISDTITITLNSGTADDNIGKGFDVASFGHELFHLLRQESDELQSVS
jgi:hypothetical protein